MPSAEQYVCALNLSEPGMGKDDNLYSHCIAHGTCILSKQTQDF